MTAPLSVHRWSEASATDRAALLERGLGDVFEPGLQASIVELVAEVRRDSAGGYQTLIRLTVETQQRVRTMPALEAVAVDPASGSFESMRTLAPPTGRGW